MYPLLICSIFKLFFTSFRRIYQTYRRHSCMVMYSQKVLLTDVTVSGYCAFYGIVRIIRRWIYLTMLKSASRLLNCLYWNSRFCHIKSCNWVFDFRAGISWRLTSCIGYYLLCQCRNKSYDDLHKNKTNIQTQLNS